MLECTQNCEKYYNFEAKNSRRAWQIVPAQNVIFMYSFVQIDLETSTFCARLDRSPGTSNTVFPTSQSNFQIQLFPKEKIKKKK